MLSVNGRVELGIEGEAGTVEPVPVTGPVERGEGVASAAKLLGIFLVGEPQR
jgi:hypothetical protein